MEIAFTEAYPMDYIKLKKNTNKLKKKLLSFSQNTSKNLAKYFRKKEGYRKLELKFNLTNN
jgi:outer membrane phospholipase A